MLSTPARSEMVSPKLARSSGIPAMIAPESKAETKAAVSRSPIDSPLPHASGQTATRSGPRAASRHQVFGESHEEQDQAHYDQHEIVGQVGASCRVVPTHRDDPVEADQ